MSKQFEYKAKKSATESVKGVIQAASRMDAVDKINALGLTPVDVSEVSTKKNTSTRQDKSAVDLTKATLPVRDLSVFYRQLGRLLKAGMPILKALSMMMEQSESAVFKQILEKFSNEVRDGGELSGSMKQIPKIFGSFDIAMIQAGESVGRLDQTLAQLADYHHRQAVIRSKVKGALAYPLFVLLVGFGTIAFMLTHVIPQFSGFFLDLGQELPLPTKILIASSQWTKANGWIVVVVIAVFVIVLRQLLKVPANKKKWHRFCINLPKWGGMIRMSQIARFSRTMELLLHNGIPLLKSIRTAIPVLDNEIYKEELEKCYSAVEEGGALSQHLRESGLFPLMAVYLIRTGEESGSLHESMSEIAEWYETEVSDHIEVLTKLIEPALILILGLFLGAIVMALLLPVFSMNAMVG